MSQLMLETALRRCLLPVFAATVFTACATIQEIAALRSVGFELDRVAEVHLAGIDVSRMQTASELSLTEAGQVTTALARRELPLSFKIHLRAVNPASNSVTARLVRMQWTLLLENTETVSGVIDREYVLAPGRPTDIPVDVSLDLLRFYERSGPDLLDLALNLTGNGGQPKLVTVRAVPTITTALGDISYPHPITIASATVGHSVAAGQSL
jgi:hypothetical protein